MGAPLTSLPPSTFSPYPGYGWLHTHTHHEHRLLELVVLLVHAQILKYKVANGAGRGVLLLEPLVLQHLRKDGEVWGGQP